MSRTQQEILGRVAAVTDDDWGGFRREVLIGALDYEHAKRFLEEGVAEAEWSVEDPATEGREYLVFAIGKIADHRGISAGRSVDKLTEYAWLMGCDDVVSAMEAADYPQYGAPMVKAFALGMGWDSVWAEHTTPAVERMASGDSCRDDCDEGCS